MPGAPGLAIFETWDRFAIAKLGDSAEESASARIESANRVFPRPGSGGIVAYPETNPVPKAQNGWRLPKGVLFW